MTALPDTLPGHWSTPEGREMAETYLGLTRDELIMADKTDLELANAIYMVDRDALDFIVVQTAAKERIRWLSAQLAVARLALAARGIYEP